MMSKYRIQVFGLFILFAIINNANLVLSADDELARASIISSNNDEVTKDELNKEIVEDDLLPINGLQLEHETIPEEQADQPLSGERFVAVHVEKVGAIEHLKPNLVALTNMAYTFLPKTYKLSNVISGTREIVAGVKFDLILNTTDENGGDVICQLSILEKPWKITEWGVKLRTLEYTNCTSATAAVETDQPNEHDFNFNPLFVHKNNEMTEEDMKLLEAQIIKPKITTTTPSYPSIEDYIITMKPKSTSTTTSTTESNSIPESPVPTLSDSVMDELDKLFLVDINDKHKYERPAVEVNNEAEFFKKVESPNLEASPTVSTTTTGQPSTSFETNQIPVAVIYDDPIAASTANVPGSSSQSSNINHHNSESNVIENLKEVEKPIVSETTETASIVDDEMLAKAVEEINEYLNLKEGENLETKTSENELTKENLENKLTEITSVANNLPENVTPETGKLVENGSEESLPENILTEKNLPDATEKSLPGNVSTEKNAAENIPTEKNALENISTEKTTPANTPNEKTPEIISTDKNAPEIITTENNLPEKDSPQKSLNENTSTKIPDISTTEKVVYVYPAELSPPSIKSIALKFDTPETTENASIILPSTDKTTEESDESSEENSKSSEESHEESGQSSHKRDKRSNHIEMPNTEKLYLLELANKAVEQLDHVDSDEYKRIVLDILYAKKIERHNETIYILTMRSGNSHCIEETSDIRGCLKSIIKGTTKLCKIEIRVKRDVVQVLKSECSPDKTAAASPSIRSKRDILVGAPISGDDEDTEKIKTYINNALVKLSAQENGPQYSLLGVSKVSVQVVAGKLYKLEAEFGIPNSNDKEICNVEVWVRPWLKENSEDVKFDCGEKKQYHAISRRSLLFDRHQTEDIEANDNEKKVAHAFYKFKRHYNRNYATSMEHDMRLRIFRQNLNLIDQLNMFEQGTATYGITDFADLTPDEYKHRTGLWSANKLGNDIPNVIADIPNVELPTSFDWREKGAVTSVKNQGSCGSCWAFSVTGNIEGLHAIKTGTLEEYSEQELVDCDTIDGGCNGGLPDNAYKAIEQLGGLELESEYPYEAKKEQCHFDKSKSHVRVSGAVDLPKNETAMAQWLSVNGPLSIGLNANAMQFYRGGISHPWKLLCNRSTIDHGVLIVGYGISEFPALKKSLPYWIVKNSWGPSWGEHGYYRVYRGDNTCGLTSMVSSAVLESD